MSKKLAAGPDALVLDVKVGEGAFMTQPAQARELAELMVRIGRRAGKRTVALVTAMDQPLGRTVGDALEVQEAVETLRGDGPEDFTELSAIVAGYMLLVGGKAATAGEGERLARAALHSGAGVAKLKELIQAQGGRPEVVDAPESLLADTESHPVTLAREGYVVSIDGRALGFALRELKETVGAGKARCGLRLHVKCGEKAAGAPVATLLARAAQGRP